MTKLGSRFGLSYFGWPASTTFPAWRFIAGLYSFPLMELAFLIAWRIHRNFNISKTGQRDTRSVLIF